MRAGIFLVAWAGAYFLQVECNGQLKFSGSGGISWKSDPMNSFSFKRIPDDGNSIGNPNSLPYNSSGNGGLSGFGITPSLALTGWNIKLSMLQRFSTMFSISIIMLGTDLERLQWINISMLGMSFRNGH